MGGVRHRCEQGAQKRPGPPGEKDGDTATGACAVSVYMAVSVNVCVHCAGRVCAGRVCARAGAGASHGAGGGEVHGSATSAAHTGTPASLASPPLLPRVTQAEPRS